MAILNSTSLDFEFLHFLIPSYSTMWRLEAHQCLSLILYFLKAMSLTQPSTYQSARLLAPEFWSSLSVHSATLPAVELKSSCLLNGFVKWRESRSINEVSLDGFEERHGQLCTPSLCRAGDLMAGLQPCDKSTLLLSLLPITPNSHFKVEDINSCFNVPIY